MNILIVDDDAASRTILRDVLEGAGYTVDEAADGVEALRRLAETTVHCVITDILMPNMDGYRLCYEIRNSPQLSQLPVIVHTATYTAAGDEKLASELGADRFIRKPAVTGVIASAVRAVLTGERIPQPYSKGGVERIESMQHYSRQLVNKLEHKNLELERQAAALRESEQRIQQIFESVNDALFVMSIDGQGHPGRLLQVNEVACFMLGYTREEMLVRSVRDFDLPEEEASFRQLADRLQIDKRMVVERTLLARGGRRIATEISIRTFESRGEKMAIAAVRDITERLQAAEARRERDRRQ